MGEFPQVGRVIPALHLATAIALQGMTKQELEALKLRIEEKRV